MIRGTSASATLWSSDLLITALSRNGCNGQRQLTCERGALNLIHRASKHKASITVRQAVVQLIVRLQMQRWRNTMSSVCKQCWHWTPCVAVICSLTVCLCSLCVLCSAHHPRCSGKLLHGRHAQPTLLSRPELQRGAASLPVLPSRQVRTSYSNKTSFLDKVHLL